MIYIYVVKMIGKSLLEARFKGLFIIQKHLTRIPLCGIIRRKDFYEVQYGKLYKRR